LPLLLTLLAAAASSLDLPLLDDRFSSDVTRYCLIGLQLLAAAYQVCCLFWIPGCASCRIPLKGCQGVEPLFYCVLALLLTNADLSP
jgi:hypothetical protein